MAEQGFALTSPDITSGGFIPSRFTCDGENVPPELNWIHPPTETRSFALVVDDPDAPRGTFTHWVLFDIPANLRSLPRGEGKVGIAGRNDFQHDGYGGPCPPPNHGEHRYFFKLFALDTESLNLRSGAARDDVTSAMEGHILDEAEFMGRYERSTG